MAQSDNIIFLGTPRFAATHLRALLDAGEHVKGVITKPDKPRGRGRVIEPTPVKQAALEKGIEVIEPKNPNDRETVEWIKAKNPWLLITVAFGRILSSELLGLASAGAWNVHASLLPRWRGAAPVARAIENGDTKTGITLMMMDTGLDTGDMLLTAETEIGPEETAGELEARLEKMGCRILLEGLKLAREGKLIRKAQPDEGVTMAPPMSKEEANIDWNRPAIRIHNKIRALNPHPGARTGELKILRSRLHDGISEGSPGAIKEMTSDGIVVFTGEGPLCLVEVQPPGKRKMSASDYARGKRLAPGDLLIGT